MNNESKSARKTDSKGQKRQFRLMLAGLIVLLAFSVILALHTGRYHISIKNVLGILASGFTDVEHTWEPMAESVIFTLRLPRIIGAILVGGALALAGSCYQGVFKNPLVSPDLLGVSSGACVGASIAILLGVRSYSVQVFAFIMGMLTVGMTMTIPKLFRNDSITMLVLSGIIVRGLMTSVMGVIKYIADPETQLAEITYWQMGSLAKVTSSELGLVSVPIIIMSLIVIAMSWQVNLLSLGDNEAKALGVKVSVVRGILIMCSTFLIASSVCLSGTIGWVGLVIPHFGRMLVGPDNVKNIPVSFFLGALFLLVVDTVARSASSLEIPLSILTGLIGAPFYVYILAKQRMKL